MIVAKRSRDSTVLICFTDKIEIFYNSGINCDQCNYFLVLNKNAVWSISRVRKAKQRDFFYLNIYLAQ